MQPLIEAGELVAIGVVQEQHPERAALYRQWRELRWPIWVDSLGLIGLEAVPVPLLLDEAGVVRASGRSFGAVEDPVALRAAIRDVFASAPEPPELPADWNRAPMFSAAPPAPQTNGGGAAEFHRFQLGHDSALALQQLDRAVAAFEVELETRSEDPAARFRLGVALRARADGPTRRPGDAQRAVVLWQEALAARPSQYIWRRRLQQYGPSLTQPYSFYDWIHSARAQIAERGEVPLALAVEPRGSELADPDSKSAPGARTSLPDPDPLGAVPRDSEGWISLDLTATPARVRPGERAMLRLSFRVDRERAHWNNETDPLRIHLGLPDGVTLIRGDIEAPKPAQAESDEERVLELELEFSERQAAGELRLEGYALYYACDTSGVCRYLRRDFSARLVLDPAAEPLR